MSLVLNSSGGGSVTITGPTTASNFTQDIVAASGSLPVAAASGVLNAGSVSGTLCRAWVNFNGTGTVAIRASFNVSSITDNGVGLYSVNFATAMPDANYSTVISAQETSAGSRDGFLQIRGGGTYSTSAVQISSGVVNAFNALDNAIINVAIFR